MSLSSKNTIGWLYIVFNKGYETITVIIKINEEIKILYKEF